MFMGMVPWLGAGPEGEAPISTLPDPIRSDSDPHPPPPCRVLDRACCQAVFSFPRLETQ